MQWSIIVSIGMSSYAIVYHCMQWSIIVSIGMSLYAMVYHCMQWSIIVSIGMSLYAMVYHCMQWSIIVSIGMSLYAMVYHCMQWSIIVSIGMSLYAMVYRMWWSVIVPIVLSSYLIGIMHWPITVCNVFFIIVSFGTALHGVGLQCTHRSILYVVVYHLASVVLAGILRVLLIMFCVVVCSVFSITPSRLALAIKCPSSFGTNSAVLWIKHDSDVSNWHSDVSNWNSDIYYILCVERK